MTTENGTLPEQMTWSVRRLARANDVSERFVWKKIADGDLGAIRVGRRTLVPHTEARRFFLGEGTIENS